MTWPPIRQCLASYLAAQDGPTYSRIRAHFQEMGAPFSRIEILQALQAMVADGAIVQHGPRFHLERRELAA
jgi:hypothetical protein